MTERKLTIITLLLMLIFPAVVVLASHHEREQETDYAPFIVEQNYQGIPYVSGGVGVGEREELREEMTRFNLKLIFALTSGAYVADIPVEIKDQQGKVILDVKSEGPWLYVSLPAGSYTITTSMDQITKEKTITLEAEKRQEVRFIW